jgi:nicotinamidase-related amidase
MTLELARRAVLVVIDMQQGFDDPSLPPRWNADVDRNGQRVLAAFRVSGRDVIHVRHDSVESGSVLRPGTAGNGWRPGFEPQDGEALLSKSVNAAFIGTDLDLRLRRLGAQAVVVFGFTTDQCVSTTVRVGANMGWPMVLVEDACDCFTLPDGHGGIIPAAAIQAAHVATLRAEFARVVTTNDIVQALADTS